MAWRRPERSVGTPTSRSPTTISPPSCGMPAGPPRVRTASRFGSSCCATAPAPGCKQLLGERFGRVGREARRRRVRPSRFADSMQHFVDQFEQMPVVVLVCLSATGGVAVRGCLGVSRLPEPAARGPGARLWGRAHHVAPGSSPSCANCSPSPTGWPCRRASPWVSRGPPRSGEAQTARPGRVRRCLGQLRRLDLELLDTDRVALR